MINSPSMKLTLRDQKDINSAIALLQDELKHVGPGAKLTVYGNFITIEAGSKSYTDFMSALNDSGQTERYHN